MDKASELLVIILSSVLVVFIIVCIVAAIKVVQILNTLKRISEKAENLADSAEAIGSYFQKAATPIAFSRFLHNITEVFIQHKKTKK